MHRQSDAADIDYGPLTGLIGTWKGDKGRDIAPEPDGSEENLYYETLTFQPVDEVINAERQSISAIGYHQTVHRISDNKAIHDQLGYWMWDAETQCVMHSLVIPRAVCVLAGGKATYSEDSPEMVNLEVSAQLGNSDWGIIQSPFMHDQARTVEFQQKIQIAGDQLSYAQTSVLEIYGRSFEHTDENVLDRL